MSDPRQTVCFVSRSPADTGAVGKRVGEACKADTVGVVVVEDVKPGKELTGWIMETDETIRLKAADPVPLGPGAEHLAFPAGQVEQAHIPPPPAQLAQQFQLLVGERVEDPVARLGYLVLAQ